MIILKNLQRKREKRNSTFLKFYSLLKLSKLLVIIAGPTASGKTRLAIDLALRFNTEIVSADSRQFYRELNIGTAKPSEKELKEVRHHFINSHSVSEHVTAASYGEAARNVINKLFSSHEIVILAGGSGLYIDAVINGFDDLPSADVSIRKNLEDQFQQYGIKVLQDQLKEIDIDSFSRIDINNPRRLIRAIEVTIASGKPYSKQLGKQQNSNEWEWLIAGIDWPREELYNRINERTQLMIRDGLREETLSVQDYRQVNALSTVGYKEMFDHLDGKITLDDAAAQIAQHTRNYAKRQLTWFRKYNEMIWLKPGEEFQLVEIIEKKSGISKKF